MNRITNYLDDDAVWAIEALRAAEVLGGSFIDAAISTSQKARSPLTITASSPAKCFRLGFLQSGHLYQRSFSVGECGNAVPQGAIKRTGFFVEY
jgi:hypothetical protein